MTATAYHPSPLPSAPEQEARAIGNVLLALETDPDGARSWVKRLRAELFEEHVAGFEALVQIAPIGRTFTLPAFVAALTRTAHIDHSDASARCSGYMDTQRAAGIEADFAEALAELERTCAQRRKIQTARRMEREAWDGVGLDVAGETATPLLTFLTPAQILAWRPAHDLCLVGEGLVTRGEVVLIAGAPGIGKSRAVFALAVSGTTGSEWLGQPVRCRFRTLFIQCENGMHRLHADFSALQAAGVDLEGSVEVLAPPDVGLAFGRPEFRAEVLAACQRLQAGGHPLLVVVDPWTECTQGDDKDGYQTALRNIRASLPKGDDAPALAIVCHTRKPKEEERASGRSLLNTIAGSYSIGSAARAAFVLQKVTDESADPRRVWSCCKANNCEMPAPTAWTCVDAGFSAITDFDWEAWRGGNSKPTGRPAKVTEAHVREAFVGSLGAAKKVIAARLEELAKCSTSKAYEAIDRHTQSGFLELEGGLYRLADRFPETDSASNT